MQLITNFMITTNAYLSTAFANDDLCLKQLTGRCRSGCWSSWACPPFWAPWPSNVGAKRAVRPAPTGYAAANTATAEPLMPTALPAVKVNAEVRETHRWLVVAAVEELVPLSARPYSSKCWSIGMMQLAPLKVSTLTMRSWQLRVLSVALGLLGMPILGRERLLHSWPKPPMKQLVSVASIWNMNE